MNKNIRMIVLMFVIVMILSSCRQHRGSPNDYIAESVTESTSVSDTAAETEAPGDGLAHIIENGVSNYVIIRPDKADQEVIDQAIRLRNEIEKVTGVALELKTDWYKPGEEPDPNAKEILIGSTNRLFMVHITSIYDMIESRGCALVGASNTKIGIYGTKNLMTQVATDWFIENCLYNSVNAGQGYFTIPVNTGYRIYENELSPSYFITPDKDNSLNLTKIRDIDSIENHKVLQGACTDGTYAYVVLENQTVSPSVDIIRKYNISTWEPVKDSQPLAIDHGNDLCYNSKTGMLVAVHNAPNKTRISFINPDTLEVTETKTIGYSFYSITYNATLDRYVLGISDGFNFVIVDSDFKYVGKRFIIGHVTGYTKQGMDSDDKYIYFVQSGLNCIVVYDWDGNYIKTIFLTGIEDETEAIFHIGPSFYVTFNIDYKTHGAIYKVDIK